MTSSSERTLSDMILANNILLLHDMYIIINYDDNYNYHIMSLVYCVKVYKRKLDKRIIS